MEPQITSWNVCVADTTNTYLNPNDQPQSYNCSKTLAGWFRELIEPAHENAKGRAIPVPSAASWSRVIFRGPKPDLNRTPLGCRTINRNLRRP